MSIPRLALSYCIVASLVILAFAAPASAQPFDEAPDQLRVMTWNVEWMFDDYQGDNRSDLSKQQSAPSREFWQTKLDAVVQVIAASNADIVALQEIESDRTLRDIMQALRKKPLNSYYRYAFIQGSDSFTEQDVGLLYRSGMAHYRRHEQSKTMYDSEQFYNISKHIVAEFRWSNTSSPLTLMNVHFRATADAEDKRVRQARLARHWLEPQLKNGEDVLLLGDFNSEYPAGTYSGDIAATGRRSSEFPMTDLLERLPDPQQATHVALGKQFDRLMASASLLEDGPGLDWTFQKIEVIEEGVIRGEPDGVERWDIRLDPIQGKEVDVSDHLPVVATFELR